MSKYTLIFRAKAALDLEEIESYYNEISTKITKQFFNILFEILGFIERDPNLFQERYRQVRIATLHKFPYGVHYKIVNDKVIILRVLHFKRFYKK